MSATTEPRRRIDPTRIPDETLRRLRKLAVEKVLPIAPRFGEWLRKWIETNNLRDAKTLRTAGPSTFWRCR